jgi:hypothetical protein
LFESLILLIVLKFLKMFYVQELDCFALAAGNQILAVWLECGTVDVLTMALQRSYLLLRLYAPELDCVFPATGSQILAVWRKCDGVDPFTVALKRS